MDCLRRCSAVSPFVLNMFHYFSSRPGGSGWVRVGPGGSGSGAAGVSAGSRLLSPSSVWGVLPRRRSGWPTPRQQILRRQLSATLGFCLDPGGKGSVRNPGGTPGTFHRSLTPGAKGGWPRPGPPGGGAPPTLQQGGGPQDRGFPEPLLRPRTQIQDEGQM